MQRFAVLLAAVAMLFPATSTVLGAVIDFESFPSTPFSSYTESGVTFTPVGSPTDTCQALPTPNGTRGIAGGESFAWLPVRADISGGTGSVAVDLGDFSGGDSETLYLEVFNQAGQSLGRAEQYQSLSDPVRMYTLSLTLPGIAYAEFGSYGGLYGSGVLGDNFTFDSSSPPIPEPSTVLIWSLLAGLGLLWYRRR